jgi:hypothetical protein
VKGEVAHRLAERARKLAVRDRQVDAARNALAAWDKFRGSDGLRGPMTDAMDGLRHALAARPEET